MIFTQLGETADSERNSHASSNDTAGLLSLEGWVSEGSVIIAVAKCFHVNLKAYLNSLLGSNVKSNTLK